MWPECLMIGEVNLEPFGRVCISAVALAFRSAWRWKMLKTIVAYCKAEKIGALGMAPDCSRLHVDCFISRPSGECGVLHWGPHRDCFMYYNARYVQDKVTFELARSYKVNMHGKRSKDCLLLRCNERVCEEVHILLSNVEYKLFGDDKDLEEIYSRVCQQVALVKEPARKAVIW